LPAGLRRAANLFGSLKETGGAAPSTLVRKAQTPGPTIATSPEANAVNYANFGSA
jgi:hypothetical protein